MILFVNACVRPESRTYRLAKALLEKQKDEIIEINLTKENLKPLDNAQLEKRTELIEKADYSDPMFRYAKLVADADKIIFAAPYWDMSFPSVLKVFIENVYVSGIVSRYSEEGIPVGMCKGSKMYYVVTAGGPYVPDYSYNYIKNIFLNFFGYKDAELIKAEFLDIVGNNPEKIMSETINKLKKDM